ncbi:D-alanine--D-alanine ligase [Ignavibacterium sp.]|uniref:D-alanine--D-alanine ligase family protein n=1 Tax=Ignavibacterium sp. TaxID=2651167 RepID=UPI00220F569F|nr:D-alanine--D-alanine ligase [Ignavibacterium sp.]BDQ04184.1 MAG: D-alanine--D-alanine ligase [Ignavibacterium sp.]
MHKKLNIILLVGGTSTERYISKLSSKSIYNALKTLGHEVILLDPAYGDNQPTEPGKFFDENDFTETSNSNYIKCFNRKEFDSADLVFIGLHGKWGEDGTVQAILDLKGVKYTGSKTLSSAVTMDKILSKILFDKFNIPTPKWFSFNNSEMSSENVAEKIEKELDYPAIIKPNDQGSTVGLSVCRNKNDVKQALSLARDYSEKILVEEFIPGRELTVGVLGEEALPVLEIKPKHEIYDYECKYTSGMSEYIVPAEIPENISKQLQETSLLAFKYLECEGYARIDFRLSPENKYYLLEINTLPGMTSLSLVPKMAKAVGISFEQLIDRIIQLSL